MTQNETRISNERLAERGVEVLRLLARSNDRLADVAVISSWVHDVRQALRSTPVEAEPDFYALHSPTRSHIGLWPKKDDAEQAQREYENSTLTPLYAHPLPNPSPSDGEVSEEMVEQTTGKLFNRLGLERFGMRFEDVKTVAREILQSSKRGQP